MQVGIDPGVFGYEQAANTLWSGLLHGRSVLVRVWMQEKATESFDILDQRSRKYDAIRSKVREAQL